MVSIVIPAFNEQAGISQVLQAINHQQCQVKEVIVVNNGSSDQTAQRAEALGGLVLHESRRGYGRACLCALTYIAKQIEQPTIVVFLDADYSDYPEQMDRLLKPIWDNQADLVIGSRVLGDCAVGAMTLPQRWGNRLATFLLKLLYGHRATDLGPFRAVRYTALTRLGMRDTNYGWNIEMQIRALKQGLRCIEVPVSYRCRLGRSKISGTLSGVVGAGYKIIITLFRYY